MVAEQKTWVGIEGKRETKTGIQLKLVAIRVCCLAVLLFLVGCYKTEEERQVEQLVDDLGQSFGDHSIKGLLKSTTRDFVALPGRVNKKTAVRQLFHLFQLNRNITALYPRPEIECDSENSASVSLPFLLINSGAENSALEDLFDSPDQWVEQAQTLGKVHQVELSLVRKDGQWFVQTARFF